jgi:hypothetical protein
MFGNGYQAGYTAGNYAKSLFEVIYEILSIFEANHKPDSK